VAVRHLADEPFPASSPTVSAGHIGRGSGFIDEHQASRIKLGLLSAPRFTRRGDVGPVLFFRVQAFF
jgi:hypothetical protein